MTSEPTSIRLYCFARTQEPKDETDYFDVIDHKNSGCPLSLVNFIKAVHKSFAKAIPADRSIFCLPFEADGEEYLCFGLIQTERNRGPRAFPRLMAIAGNLDDFRGANVDPDYLLGRIDGPEDAFTKPIMDLKLEARASRRQPSTSLAKKITTGFQFPEAPMDDPGESLGHILAGIAQVSGASGKVWYETAFAVHVPTKWQPPYTLALIIHEPKISPPSRPVNPPALKTLPSPRAATSLQIIAEHLEREGGVKDFWRFRLWNICQDLMELEQRFEVLDGSRDTRSLRRQKPVIQREYHRLKREFDRAGCREEYKVSLNTWWIQFQERYYSTPADGPIAGKLNLSRRFPAALVATIALAIFAMALAALAIKYFIFPTSKIPATKSTVPVSTSAVGTTSPKAIDAPNEKRKSRTARGKGRTEKGKQAVKDTKADAPIPEPDNTNVNAP